MHRAGVDPHHTIAGPGPGHVGSKWLKSLKLCVTTGARGSSSKSGGTYSLVHGGVRWVCSVFQQKTDAGR